MSKTRKEFKEALKSEVSPLLIALRNDLKKMIGQAEKDVKIQLTKDGLGIAVVKGADGMDGKDAVVDYKMILARVEKMIPAPKRGQRGIRGLQGKTGKNGSTPIKGIHYHDGKDGVDGKTIIKNRTYTAEELLEIISLIGIPTSMINGLEDYVENIASNTKPWQQGGFGGSGIQTQTVKFMVNTPQGLIDGTNTIYTVLNNITAIISLTINGEFIHPSVYSFVANIINFSTPLDSSLSGLPFTCVYV